MEGKKSRAKQVHKRTAQQATTLGAYQTRKFALLGTFTRGTHIRSHAGLLRTPNTSDREFWAGRLLASEHARFWYGVNIGQ
jgi:hypothetical protein